MNFKISFLILILIVQAVTAGNYKKVVIDEYSADKVEDSNTLFHDENSSEYELMEVECSVFENHDSYELKHMTSDLMFGGNHFTSNFNPGFLMTNIYFGGTS